MDSNKLRSQLTAKGWTAEQLLQQLDQHGVHMSLTTWYKKLRGQTEFTRKEIEGLSKVLNLDRDAVMAIFFTEEVS